MPLKFMEFSKNKDIFESYDLNVSLRRPDIILKFKDKNRTFYRLIEVKRTNDKNYINDSVYKVLGYLKDFEYCFKDTSNPQGILAIWDGTDVNNMIKALEQPVFIIQNESMEKGLIKILNQF